MSAAIMSRSVRSSRFFHASKSFLTRHMVGDIRLDAPHKVH
jgi:hypothetical protein